ncbi:dTDP-4-dehydrorhamnose reductase [Marinimicrobium sp. ABcell2]|uniref:dTDP-4-dehydrorhamnose reductase n=1 Tax=Marinimicrobium sp. ABcell2 TaxID=3069751 RepID=UPI0027B51097|nr:dTDP-4-dehydrorhamnose reductase [Marinimicrobium sp. ABcell2]MDQ2078342.1 dTDP-4-dehydrorhamnose reductase [Marinimicrobium sp. ABcell2]
MKVLVTGSGQLAWELSQTVPATIELIEAPRGVLDITDRSACLELLQKHQPNWVVNTAAYTAVDRAEQEREKAFAANEQGAANVAEACKLVDARLVHVSTDFVFDGRSNTPYLPEAPVNPLSVYGSSKLAGERAVASALPSTVIVRTSWLYSSTGANFVKTILRLMAEKPELNVVADQVGSPTWARGLASVLWRGVMNDVAGGRYHWSDAGPTTWYDFAVAIQELALELNILDQSIPVRAIPTSAYPTPAARPAYSVLDTQLTENVFGVEAEGWRSQLKAMLLQLKG